MRRKPVFEVLDHILHKMAVQPQRMARGLKCRFWEVEELTNLCCENKGADQLCCCRAADICFRSCK